MIQIIKKREFCDLLLFWDDKCFKIPTTPDWTGWTVSFSSKGADNPIIPNDPIIDLFATKW